MRSRVRGTRAGPGGPAIAIDVPRRGPSARENEFHRRIVEGMTCGVLTVDRAGTITTVNEVARTILDLGGKEVAGKPCQEVLAHCPRLAQILLDSFSMASPPSRAEIEIRTRDRSACAIGFSISMIGGGARKEPDGAALFFKDLTKVEEQEERERLRDRLAVLGEMAAQMAHEIRNPLTSIDVAATLQKRRLSVRGNPTDLVDLIAEEVVRIETTIANCLSYARPLSLRPIPTDAVLLLEEVIALAAQRARSQNVLVERIFSSDLPVFLCDSALLREVLFNLLVNAHEAMDGKGRITIGAESILSPSLRDPGAAPSPAAVEPFLLIRIQDTGPGIPLEVRDRIFYPFFTTKTSGSGIGLATARKVVEAHGGWLDVDSEPGQGATFMLKIPMPAPSSKAACGGGA